LEVLVYVSELELRVRYAETDQMRVAHHASYLVWFEAGRTEFIRACGRSYAQLEEDGWLLVVIEAHCRYRHPARYDDVLTLRTRLRELGPARLSFGYELVRARVDGARGRRPGRARAADAGVAAPAAGAGGRSVERSREPMTSRRRARSAGVPAADMERWLFCD
jgi:acyl-CoA thioester hydrolase